MGGQEEVAEREHLGDLAESRGAGDWEESAGYDQQSQEDEVDGGGCGVEVRDERGDGEGKSAERGGAHHQSTDQRSPVAWQGCAVAGDSDGDDQRDDDGGVDHGAGGQRAEQDEQQNRKAKVKNAAPTLRQNTFCS